MQLGELLTQYWPIVATVGAFIIIVIRMESTVGSLKDRIETIEKKIEAMNPIWSEIQSRLASIETTLQFLTKGMK